MVLFDKPSNQSQQEHLINWQLKNRYRSPNFQLNVRVRRFESGSVFMPLAQFYVVMSKGNYLWDSCTLCGLKLFSKQAKTCLQLCLIFSSKLRKFPAKTCQSLADTKHMVRIHQKEHPLIKIQNSILADPFKSLMNHTFSKQTSLIRKLHAICHFMT